MSENVEEEDRFFYKCSLIYPTGKRLEECFWGFKVIPICRDDEIKTFAKPRKFKLILEAGLYFGVNGRKEDWITILKDKHR